MDLYLERNSVDYQIQERFPQDLWNAMRIRCLPSWQLEKPKNLPGVTVETCVMGTLIVNSFSGRWLLCKTSYICIIYYSLSFRITNLLREDCACSEKLDSKTKRDLFLERDSVDHPCNLILTLVNWHNIIFGQSLMKIWNVFKIKH